MSEDIRIIRKETLANPTNLGAYAVRDISGALNALLAVVPIRSRKPAGDLKLSHAKSI